MLLKDFSHGFRTNNITSQSLQAGKNVELKPTAYGLGIYRSNGNVLLNQIEGEEIIGGFDYIKGDNNFELIFTNDGTESKAYLYFNETLTLIKDSMSVNAKHFNAVNFNNGAFVTNGIDAPFFYEYGVGVTDIPCVAYGGENIRGLAVKVFDNRIFMGSGSGLYSCGLGDHTDWNSADVETTRAGYIKNFMNSSATIKAIENYQGKLIIHRTFDTVWLSGTSGSYSMDVISNVGCVNPFAVTNLDLYQIYFLNHINGIGLYYLSKNELGTIKAESEISQFIHEEFRNIDTTRADEVYCLANTKKNEIWTHIPRTDYTNNSYWLIFNLTTKCFYPPRITQPITSAWLYKGEIHVGTSDGKILREDRGNTFDGENISFEATTASLDFGTLELKEFEEQCNFILAGTILNKFMLSFIADDDESIETSTPIEQLTYNCMFWVNDYDDVTDPKYFWGEKWADSVPLIIQEDPLSGFSTLKIRFSGDDGDIGLMSLELPRAIVDN